MNKKIKEILIKYKSILKEKGFETYSLDCEILLMNVTGFNKINIYTNLDYELSDEQFKKFLKYFERRLKNEPIAYIIGKCEFMGIDFLLNEHTLIPRSDTEILVEKVISIINENKFKSVIDIGTGSGAIAISIAKYCEGIKVFALDINKGALLKAKENSSLNMTLDKISFIESDLFENVYDKFDIIVSNPPYIRTKDILLLDENVKEYEPTLALDGGEDGLIFYQRIIKDANNFLNTGGYLAFEIGHDQSKDVENLMKINGFLNINILKDLSGFDRVIFGNIK